MKYFLIPAIILVVVFLQACKKSNGSSNASTNQLIGSWEQISSTVTEIDSTATPPITKTQDSNYVHGKSFILKFTSNYLSWDSEDGTSIDEGIYTVSNGQIFCYAIPYPTNYAIAGDTLTLASITYAPGLEYIESDVFLRQ